jgi:hypothetical protein
MQPVPEGKSRASWAFDLAVMVVGAALGASAAIGFAVSGGVGRGWVATCLVAVPLIFMLSQFPLRLSRHGVGIEVGFESAVLVTLVVLGDTRGALTIWALGQATTQLVKRKRLDVRLFNIGITIICGTAAVLIMQLGGRLGSTSPQELLAVAAGCVVFFVLDYLISAMSVAIEEQTSFRSQLQHGSAVLAGLVFVGIDSIGYLAGLVRRELP